MKMRYWIWLIFLAGLWGFIGGADLLRWRIISKCGETGTYVINQGGTGTVMGGCTVLAPGVYEIRRIR